MTQKKRRANPVGLAVSVFLGLCAARSHAAPAQKVQLQVKSLRTSSLLLPAQVLRTRSSAAFVAPAQAQGVSPAVASAMAMSAGVQAGSPEFKKGYDGGKDGADGGAPPVLPSSSGGASDGGLRRLYPRVVMLLDTFNAPASDAIAHHIETLANNGVHVVFVTPRADKGADSADSILVSKLKVRKSRYPITVASYNGARIALHNTHAEHPASIIEDLPGIPERSLQAFRRINAQLKQRFGLSAEAVDETLPAAETAYHYNATFPAGSYKPGALVQAYNQALRSAGYKYKMELAPSQSGVRLTTQSTALRLNTQRLFEALYAQYPELRESLKPKEILILADSTRAAKFLRSLPGKHFIHGVTDNASIERALGAVLGDQALEPVNVNRSLLRDYTEWLDAKTHLGGPRWRDFKFNYKYVRGLAFYRGSVMQATMNVLYDRMRKGMFNQASVEDAQQLFMQIWNNPQRSGVWLSPEVASAMKSPKWKMYKKGYIDLAMVWLRNYYKRQLKDFPIGVGDHVVGTMMNLKSDAKNKMKLSYAAPYTGRRYMVHAQLNRTHLQRDDKGNLLEGHVYRVGKEPTESEFEDTIEGKILARAMLESYAERRDGGRWYVNDEPNPRIKIVFHYMTRDLSRVYDTGEVEHEVAEVTALIEKMLSDQEFLDHWEERNGKDPLNPFAKTGAKKRSGKK